MYDAGLEKNRANYVPLSPVSFVQRAAAVYPDSLAIDYLGKTETWSTVFQRCLKLAARIKDVFSGGAKTVSALLPNVPAAIDLAYAVPMSGAVLNMINTRLDAAGVAFILDHSECELFFVDSGLAEIAREALAACQREPILIMVNDPSSPGTSLEGAIDYTAFYETAEPLSLDDILPDDEWDAMALNYTSGTTGNPKGVVYHHRGAYLNALGNLAEWELPHGPKYLWTLPLFHCNGWCFPWTIAAMAGCNICLRAPTGEAILDAIQTKHVTHLCGAPIVLNMVTTVAEQQAITFRAPVKMMVAGAAPPASVLERAERVGFDILHVYGLTEVYGPSAVCAWKEEWNALPAEERAAKRARQGVPYATQQEVSVRDPDTLDLVPCDGQTLGEVAFKGNAVMKGYLKNKPATAQAFEGGFFRTGDLGVQHPDGYVELKDRSKDIIISGGENISSIEVESVLYKHPAVGEVAVVAAPDDNWGETPAACIELKPGAETSEQDIIEFCRINLAHFKCPRIVRFGPLPKTATGKIQKFALREQVQKWLASQ